MKRLLCVVLICVLLTGCVYEVNSISELELSYNGDEVSFPVNLGVFTDDGWYLFCKEANGDLVLLNDKYENVTIYAYAPDYIDGELSEVDVLKVTFDYGFDCESYPNVLLFNKIGFGVSYEDIVSVLGEPKGISVDFNDTSEYWFLSFHEETGEVIEAVFANGYLRSIGIDVSEVNKGR